MIKAKVSMFNRIVENNSEMILYNSYQGLKSIKKVSSGKQKVIRSILQKELSMDEAPVAIVHELLTLGYLVPYSVDEK